jgi:chromosome partitioning protein
MKVVLVMSPKGGSGKSTTVRNLSVLAVADGLATAALDLDVQGTLSHWFKVRSKLDGVGAVDVRYAAVENGAAALRSLEADVVFVDTPTAVERSPKEVKALIRAADVVVIPTQPTDDDVRSVKTMMATVAELGRPGAYLINRVRQRVKEAEGARSSLGKTGHVLAAGIPDSVEVQRAMTHGYGVAESGGKGRDEFESAWAEIRRLIGL